MEVDLREATPSSLDFEVEADFAGEVAGRYEDLEGRMATLLMELSNREQWAIPTPQLILRQVG